MYTGNAHGKSQLVGNFAVYPCVYRERRLTFFITSCNRGLSLCIQGTLFFFYKNIKSRRFIPVYTGNAPTSNIKSIKLSGLSLCIQGTHRMHNCLISEKRFIPVYTGNAFRWKRLICYVSVYPCVYRERSNYNILFYN